MFSIVAIVLTLQFVACAVSSERFLRLTAVVSDEKDDHATFECWELTTPFSTYPTVGDSIAGLAEVTNISYVILPPKSGEGIHRPPHPMFFVLLSGLAHVTLPHGDDELYIVEGVNGLIVANDIRGEGHFTDYPSDKPSVALQIPFKDGEVPKHRLVNDGVCAPDSALVQDGTNVGAFGGQIPLS